MSMYADAEMIRTPRRSSNPAVRSSSAGSAGEKIRFTPHGHRLPRAPLSSSTARSMDPRSSPAAPNMLSISARAMAITIRVVAIPRAISPAM